MLTEITVAVVAGAVGGWIQRRWNRADAHVDRLREVSAELIARTAKWLDISDAIATCYEREAFAEAGELWDEVDGAYEAVKASAIRIALLDSRDETLPLQKVTTWFRPPNLEDPDSVAEWCALVRERREQLAHAGSVMVRRLRHRSWLDAVEDGKDPLALMEAGEDNEDR